MALTTPRLVVSAPDGHENVVELRHGPQVLGHADDVDVQIRIDDVAARHAELN